MSVTFTFKEVPKTKDDLLKIPEFSLDTPFKAAALTTLVLLNYENNVENYILVCPCGSCKHPVCCR